MWKSVLQAHRHLSKTKLMGEAQGNQFSQNKSQTHSQIHVAFNYFFFLSLTPSKFKPVKDDVAPAGEFL